jgi:hypothetical protein
MAGVRGLVIAVVATSITCGPTSPTPSPQVPSGTWGGEHVQLTVTDATATVEFDCAHGTLDRPLALDRRGHFDVAGIFVREHGGPIRVDEAPDQQPARYAGIVNRRSMTMTVTMTTSPNVLGPFALVLGQPARLLKCL